MTWHINVPVQPGYSVDTGKPIMFLRLKGIGCALAGMDRPTGSCAEIQFNGGVPVTLDAVR